LKKLTYLPYYVNIKFILNSQLLMSGETIIMNNIANTIPSPLVGLGYRNEISVEIEKNRKKLDCVEVVVENYLSNERLCLLGSLADRFKVILHGVNLSIVSPFLDEAHLNRIKLACEVSNAEYYSEHLSLTKNPNIRLGHLSPIVCTKEVLDLVVRNVNTVQDYLKLPLVLENITYHFSFEPGDMCQTEFFHKLTERTGCGILLDLANVFINSQNHRFDPYKFIDGMPLANIVQIHLAGGFQSNLGVHVDSHSKPINETTWKLLDYVSRSSNIKVVIIEHDSDFPDNFNDLLSQVDRAKKTLYEAEKKHEHETI
jgi:uncharacterized protein (UPF0276 family)